jgi:hypothetical protein
VERWATGRFDPKRKLDLFTIRVGPINDQVGIAGSTKYVPTQAGATLRAAGDDQIMLDVVVLESPHVAVAQQHVCISEIFIFSVLFPISTNAGEHRNGGWGVLRRMVRPHPFRFIMFGYMIDLPRNHVQIGSP